MGKKGVYTSDDACYGIPITELAKNSDTAKQKTTTKEGDY